MAEEEKVQVDEISNKALNQLKKTIEPTAEEKFEAKRIKAALAGAPALRLHKLVRVHHHHRQ